MRPARTAACPVCSAPAPRVGVLPALHPIHACPGCGHRFALASAEQLARLYGKGYAGFRDDPVFAVAALDLFQREILPRAGGGPLLDVGCGNGAVLRIARRLAIEARGVDTSRAAVDACREQGLDAEVADFSGGAFDSGGFGLVTFWDVLEHLVDPPAFIRAAARALRPGGWLLVKVPHHRRLSLSVAAALPRISGALLSTPSHLQYFCKNSLGLVLAAGFDRVDWIEVGRLRTAYVRTSIRKTVARGVAWGIRAASGDGTLLAMARRAS